MNFNKCVRCGCFFTSQDLVCPNCKSKDEVDKLSLQSYLDNNDIPNNPEDLASLSGISVKNINRYLEMQEFSNLKEKFNNVSLN